MKLSVRDKIIVIILLMSVVLIGGYKYIWTPLGTNLITLKSEKANAVEHLKDITPLVEETKKLTLENEKMQKYVENVRLATGGLTATTEDFLVFLGDSTYNRGVSVINFKNTDYTEENGVYKAVFDFEIRGDANKINQVLSDMAKMGIKCSVGSISYRRSGEYDYLKRMFDNTSDLTWYKEPEKKDTTEKDNDMKSYESITEPGITPRIIEPNANPITPPDDTLVQPVNPEDEIDKTIVDNVIEQTAYNNGFKSNNKVVSLENKIIMPNPKPEITSKSNEMRLAVTVCLVMFIEPSAETSIINNKAGEESGVF